MTLEEILQAWRYKEMKRGNLLSIVLGFLIIGGILYFSASQFPTSITFREFGVGDISQLLTLLAMVSLFLERSLEVFINTWRRPGEEQIDAEIQNNERVIAEKTKLRSAKIEESQTITASREETEDSRPAKKVREAVAVTNVPGETETVTAELDMEMEKLKENQQIRSAFKSQTRKFALWTALFFGLLISGVGVRSLDSLVEPVAQNSIRTDSIQMFVFRFLDTLLTGGLIAGGSDGIHKITQLATTYFEETRNGIKDRASSG